MEKMPSASAHWRDSARPAMFFFMDAKAALPFLGFLLHIKWWTFMCAAIVMTFFTILSRYGYSVEIFFRILKTTIAGSRKIAIPWWKN